MTDLVGFRIVTLYDQDLPEAIDYVMALLSAGSRLPDPLFDELRIDSTLVEAKFYYRQTNDVYSICRTRFSNLVGEFLQEADFEDDITTYLKSRVIFEETREDLYSSGHIIFLANAYVDGLKIQIPVELQIRAAVEDIWAEINHKGLYKLRNHALWTSEFEDSYNDIKEGSILLKERIDNLSRSMTSFSKKAESAKSSLANFTTLHSTEDIDGIKNVAEFYKRSFGAYLFMHCGRDDGFLFGPYFEDYSETLAQLLDIHNKEDLILFLDSPFKILDNIINQLNIKINETYENNNLKPEIELDVADVTNGVKSYIKLCRQRIKICEFEKLRLRSSLVNHGIFFIAGKFVNVSDDAHGEKNKHFVKCVKELYVEICRIAESSDFFIKPLSVIYFWKYFLLARLDPAVAGRFLRQAYHELQTDPSIPKESIYRIMIPRFYATSVLLEVTSRIMCHLI